jgi:hypothetical protein
MFAFEHQPASLTVTQAMVNRMNGSGSWNVDPNCG